MAISYPNNGLTNTELIKYLELPEDIIDDLKTLQGTQFTARANEFLTALYNKVIYSRVFSMDFTNPFRKYESYPIEYGDTIENIFVEVPKGYEYDKDATDPFGRVNPVVKAFYASINVRLQYETTVYDVQLRQACLSQYGFMSLIDAILSALSKAVNIDEYFQTITLLNNEDLYRGGWTELEKGSDNSQTAAKVCRAIVDTVSSFTHPMTSNNKAGVMQVSSKERLVVIMKYGLKNSINMDYLVGLFNVEKVGDIPEIITVDGFQVAKDDGNDGLELAGDDIDFIVMDSDAFDMHTALRDGGMIYNPKGLYTNHFYNLWKIMSIKLFHNMKAFKLVDPVTSEVTEQEGE